MIVRCASCQTEFSLDDRQVGPEGAAVRCSVCGTVFRVEPADAGADPSWQVRTVDELLFTAPDLATLRAWITEGRLHPDDHVSRTGKHWMRLGDMPEFAEAFAAFQEIPGVLQPLGPGGEVSGDLGPPPAFGTADTHSPLTPPASDVEVPLEPVAAPADDAGEARGGQTLARLRLGQIAASTGPAAITEIPARGSDPRASEGPEPPATVGDDDETLVSATKAVVAAERASARSGPASMLQAVTSHVQPITRPVPADVGPKPADRSTSVVAVRETPQRVTPPVELDEERLAPAPRPRGRKLWPLASGLAVLCTAAVIFGVPGIRNAVLAPFGPEPPAVPTMYDGPEMVNAAEAMRVGDPEAIGAAEAALQARIDAADLPPEAIAAMKLAQVELLTVRALASSVRAVVDDQAREVAREEARGDADRAGRIFDALDTSQIPDRDRVRLARARLRLVQGRPQAEIVALLPESGADELRALIKAGPLLRDADARVPDGLIADLSALEAPSNLARLVLALAYLRSGDEKGAEQALAPALDEIGGQPTARALVAAIAARQGANDEASPDDSSGGEGGKADVDVEIEDAPSEEKAPERPAGPRISIDVLIDRGCGKVESGDAKGGIELLTQAHERRPSDLDVMICLGEGYRKLGSHGAALKWFERALGRNSSFPAALRGAARAAAKTGNEAKALKYYRRVLDGEPSNAEARAYIDAHGSTASANDSASGQGG